MEVEMEPRPEFEMPPADDDQSAGDVLRLHWHQTPPRTQYAEPTCSCEITAGPREPGDIVVDAGCQQHGVKSYAALRSSGGQVIYGFGR